MPRYSAPKPKQTTALDTEDVMHWIETKPHHIVSTENKKYLVLKGHHHILHIPYKIWEKCFARNDSEFDTRMFRWDHKRAAEAKLSKREKAKANASKKKAKVQAHRAEVKLKEEANEAKILNQSDFNNITLIQKPKRKRRIKDIANIEAERSEMIQHSSWQPDE